MSETPVEPIDGVQLLRTYLLHCRYVQRAVKGVAQALCDRADRHDDSKLFEDEFAGFSRINATARLHPYGSPEYRAALKAEKPTINLHYARNSHHPESHKAPREEMTWLDIIEMVCDWRGAYLAYGSKGTWEENIQKQRERYGSDEQFLKEQWWLIEQVAAFVATT